MAKSVRFITFTSDYGLEDEFVGVCRGVMSRIAPDVSVIDISHGIAPQDVVAGAEVLATAVPYMPPAVHLAVVDPGVGTARRGVVIETRQGSPLVGPDNGLLWPAAEALGGATAAYSIEKRSLFLFPVSRTFHGRDVFAPIAARIALGLPPEEAGPWVGIEDLVKLSPPAAQVDDDHVHARVVMADHFGNLQLNVARSELESVGIVLGDMIEMRVGGRAHRVRYCHAFAEVQPGRLAALEDSHRRISIAVNQGNAQWTLQARRGDPIVLGRLRASAT